MRRTLSLLSVLALLISNLISRIIPRSSKILVFGGSLGKRYADNSRYMFVYCSKNLSKRCVWLSQDRAIVQLLNSNGYEAYLSTSLIGLFLGFRAKWHIYDVSTWDTSRYSSIGAFHFNMWHGIPIKNIGTLNKASKFWSRLKSLGLRTGAGKNRYYFLAPSEEFVERYAEAFLIKPENIVISNQPRNIPFFEESAKLVDYRTTAEEKVIKKLRELRSTSKVVGYFPTWRSNGHENFLGVERFEDLIALNSVLAENNAYLLAKRHSCSFKQYGSSGYSEKSEDNQRSIESLSNFITLDYEIDLNAILPECDILVSDYSGALLDFLLAKKPMILYCYDYDEYLAYPGLYFDYESNMKLGPLVKDLSSFTECLKLYLVNEKQADASFVEERRKLTSKIFATNECFNPLIQKIESFK